MGPDVCTEIGEKSAFSHWDFVSWSNHRKYMLKMTMYQFMYYYVHVINATLFDTVNIYLIAVPKIERQSNLSVWCGLSFK